MGASAVQRHRSQTRSARRLELLRAMVGLLGAGIFACPTLADPPGSAPPLPPGALEVVLKQRERVFQPVPGRIGVWEAGPFEVTGRSPFRTWAITCEVTPLTNTAGGAAIPPSRVQVLLEGAKPASGGAQATAAAPFVVIQGGVGTRIGPQGAATFRLRIATDWLDPPGTYTGVLRVTYLATP